MNSIFIFLIIIISVTATLLWTDIIIELYNPELSFQIWTNIYYKWCYLINSCNHFDTRINNLCFPSTLEEKQEIYQDL